MKRLFIFLLIFFLGFPLVVFGNSSIDVSPSDSTYRYLNQLAGHDLVHTAIIGQRPYSREEVARLIAEARGNWEKRKEKANAEVMYSKRREALSSWVEKILKVLEKNYRRELLNLGEYKNEDNIRKSKWLELHGMENLEFQFTFLDSNKKTFPNNNLGGLSAFSQPLVQNRQGRDYTDGAQYSIESEHWLNFTKYSSFYVKPRLQFQFPSGPNRPEENHSFVQELYAVFNIYNVELQIGRSSILEGQGVHGGLILSDHARPLDHIHITNDHPIVLPWIFKHLGQNKFMFFFANLGPEYSFPRAYFAGYKWTIKPFKVWELGLSNTMTIGGDGAPDFDAGDFIGDFFGFTGTGEGKSNRILGFDSRITFPFLRNSHLYIEFFLDDKSMDSFKKTFIDDAAYYVGFYTPRLDNVGRLYSRLEFRYLSERFYRHAQFLSGYSLNREIIGDPVGPDSHSIATMVGWHIKPKTSLDFSFYYEISDSDNYRFGGDTIDLTQDNPAESRLRWIVNLEHTFKKRITFLGRFGYERVNNFNYISGDDRNHFLAEAGLTFHFGDHFTYLQ